MSARFPAETGESHRSCLQQSRCSCLLLVRCTDGAGCSCFSPLPNFLLIKTFHWFLSIERIQSRVGCLLGVLISASSFLPLTVCGTSVKPEFPIKHFCQDPVMVSLCLVLCPQQRCHLFLPPLGHLSVPQMGVCYGRCCCPRTKHVISDVGARKLSVQP